MDRNIWITWNNSRRSKNLSKDLELPIFEKVIENYFFLDRHLFSSLWTAFILVKNRPNRVYLQYSFLLLLVVVLYKRLTPYPVHVICDCHTKALRRNLKGIPGKFFWWIKAMTFHNTNLVIVSNAGMKSDIIKLTNQYYLLPDKIPDISVIKSNKENDVYCVFVCSFAADEPIEKVITAAQSLNGIARIYCTGMIPTSRSLLKKQPYRNIIFTDYLNINDYNRLLSNASCILALTSEEGCLQCAGYEALSVSVPLVVSDTSALKAYFGNAATYVKHNAEDIENGIRNAIKNTTRLRSSIEQLKLVRKQEYQSALAELKAVIANINT